MAGLSLTPPPGSAKSRPKYGKKIVTDNRYQERLRACSTKTSGEAAGRQRTALRERLAAGERGGQTARLLTHEKDLSMKPSLLILPILLAATCAAQQGWNAHEGGLLKYRVMIRFGEEPDTLPDGWRFGRVSSVAVDSAGNVYMAQRGPRADPTRLFHWRRLCRGQLYPFRGQRTLQHPARFAGRQE